MTAISVVVCTHNPRLDYFPRVLAALHAQTLPLHEWELIVIDNASALEKAPTAAMLSHPAGRVIREARLGLTPARLRGIRESVGELLVFVDDDNIVDPDFLETAMRVARERPFLGSWSGQCRPEFEEPPPEWTRRYWGNLVIREFATDVWSNLPRLAESMPCGAGLCVRRKVALRYLHLHESGKRSFQLDRCGESLLSGGDNDLAACACDIGLGVGLVASLKLKHLMPAERLTEAYLGRLAEGIHFSSTLLYAVYGVASPNPRWLRRTVNVVRAMCLGGVHGRIRRAAQRGESRARRLLALGRGARATTRC